MHKWRHSTRMLTVALVLSGYVTGVAAKEASDSTVSKIIKRSKYLEKVEEHVVKEKLKKMPKIPGLIKEIKGLRDPTQPTGLMTVGSKEEVDIVEKDQIDEFVGSWVLTSTITSPGRRSAIINGKSVFKGDKVNGAIVLEIFPAMVIIKEDKKKTVLKISSRSIRKPSN